MAFFSGFRQRVLSGHKLPLVIEPYRPTEVLHFADAFRDQVDAAIEAHGALLLRGFTIDGETAIGDLFQSLWGTALPYTYQSSPRTSIGRGTYTSTEYPPRLEITLHNENAYQRDWPMRIGFHCVAPPEAGGQTSIADLQEVTAGIDAAILSEFCERRVLYTRNYSSFMDIPWQQVFQTDDRKGVENFCLANDIGYEWAGGDLRTWQVCQGTARHPTTGNELWFNQAQLFHISTLGQHVADKMIARFGLGGVPRNARFGDGGNISDDVISLVKQAFNNKKVLFDWQRDDILLLDNMRVSHGRMPFQGSRRILLSMAIPNSTLSIS